MSITVTLGRRPELTAEETQQRIRRAAEALDACGWLFDEHISSETQALLDSPDSADRDERYRSIRAAAELKARLVQIVNSKALIDMKEKRNG